MRLPIFYLPAAIRGDDAMPQNWSNMQKYVNRVHVITSSAVINGSFVNTEMNQPLKILIREVMENA